ncbi:hypothetical protein NYZ99_12190 [Maribacter litopenaei]|uniref:Tetratricopeptide repeat-containing protein n=1 Tax=Maribacter litopenaei TaxID=2976127 RepID=A0ABY5Y6A1_9FLAO|nr:hypothetical protein [Maribacter litopenaei]UWX53882.1 hypothetical protein NYZ99_12190 [Maribacter litopenaei]
MLYAKCPNAVAASNGIHQINETEKRQQNYEDLKDLGYTEKEIYQDLGNAHFLSHNYETALFWYEKLIEISLGWSFGPIVPKEI